MAVLDLLARPARRSRALAEGDSAEAGSAGALDRALAAELRNFLSTRPDLLTISRCLGLAAERTGLETPAPEVERLVESELGARLDALFAEFDRRPFDRSAWFQWHRARLAGGAEVTVKIAHPALAPSSVTAARGAALARRALRSDEALAGWLEELVAGFERRLQHTRDLEGERRALAELRRDEARPQYLAVPKVHEGLSSPRILTLERLGGRTIEQWAAGDRAGGREKRARRLCRAWLQQALTGGLYPLDVSPRSLRLLPGGQVAFVGGPFARLPGAARDSLAGYLAATAAERPERAAGFLLDEVEVRPADLEDRLEHSFRHLAPFRDGGWLADGDRMAQVLLAQWRQVTALGLRLDEGVVDFFAALFALTRAARELAPGRDVLLAGFQELRLARLADSLGELLSDGRGAELIEQQAEVLLELPQKLDRLLDLAGRELDEQRRSPAEPEAAPRRQKPALLAALLVALATTALLVQQFGDTAWVQALGAVAVLLLGGLFLGVAAAGE